MGPSWKVFDDADVRQWLTEELTHQARGHRRCDARMRRSCTKTIVTALVEALDEVWGPSAAHAYSTPAELTQLATDLADQCVKHDTYYAIRARIDKEGDRGER